MADTTPTPAQIKTLVAACEDLAACFARDACRVIAEWPDDANLVPYLDNLPVKLVRAFDDAIAPIAWPDDFPEQDDTQVQKYEAALAEMRSAPAKGIER